jgi:hypothetical protein
MGLAEEATMAQRRTESVLEVAQQRYWREADARAVITAMEQSGRSLSRFAREYGLKRSRISRWATRLKARPTGPLRFHPVHLIEARSEGKVQDPIEVVLVDGRRVRVPAGFAAADLARVLGVLKGWA